MFSFSTIIAIIVAVGAILIVLAISQIFKEVPDEERDFMDPLPRGLRMIWPLVNLLSQHVGEYLSVDYLEKQNTVLRRAGLQYLFSPTQFFGLRLLCGLLFGLGSWLGFVVLESSPGFMPLMFGLFGFMVPFINLSDRRKVREKHLLKQLPVFLDYLTMAVQSGLNFSGAIIQAVDKGPNGPLKNEFRLVLRDMRAGRSRLDSFRSMEARTGLKEIKSFVNAIAQAERTGSSLGDVLKIQANQRRTERFQRAEKLALEAPVKLLLPLVLFIFPTTFFIIAFPIIMKFMHDL
ncbi:MAG: type II secretion system F family protein [Thiomicrorhabdus sp.]|nr:type II secretion system F family protein [Thiomicrorhabdus sp.]